MYRTTGALLAACLLAGGACSDDPVAAANPDPGTPAQSAPPDFVEDFSTYSSTANMLSDPRGIYSSSFDIYDNTSIGGGSAEARQAAGTIELDRTEGYGGLTQSLKYTWFSYGSPGPGGQIRRFLEWPSGQSEIWSEVAFKFSSNFRTDYGYTGGAAYKWLFWVGPPTGHAWNLGLLGSTGVVSQEYEDLSGGTSDKPNPYSNTFKLNNLADGQWHILAVHIRRNAPYFDVRIDGTQNRTPLTRWSSSATISALILGQNTNMRPVNNLQTLKYGYVKVWYGNNNPGWGW